MRRMKLLLPLLGLVVCIALVPAANAAITVHMIGAGSSALYQGTGAAAVNDLGLAAGTVHHYTAKGTCGTLGIFCANLEDSRVAGQDDSANLWVVYVCPVAGCNGANATDVWAYLQVDSVVGNRAFFGRAAGCAAPCHTAASLSFLDPNTQGPNVAGQSQNLISQLLLSQGVAAAASGSGCTAATNTCDDKFLPADVYAAISGPAGVAITMAGTDIRPEDAYYATQRALTPRSDNAVGGPGVTDGLGYCGAAFCNVGSEILSSYSVTGATPINFALPGNPDPITSVAVPDSTNFNTIPLGESPILILVNRSNVAQLGAPTGAGGCAAPATFFYCNAVDNTAALGAQATYGLGNLFGGNTSCDGTDAAFGLSGNVPAGGDFPLTVLLREPLSGTMNTVEFSTFRIYGGNGHGAAGTSVNNSPTFNPPTSQEMNVTPTNRAPGNPLGITCAGGGAHVGIRHRVIGTGEMVSGTSGAGGILNVANSIGYAFFSFGNVKAISNSASYGYLTLDGVDALFSSQQSGDAGNKQNGELPVCSVPCPANGIWTTTNYFPNIFNGTYRSWSALRVVCDNTDANCTDKTKGVVALVANYQDDIHCGMAGTCVAGHPAASPDFLPFSEDGSFGAGCVAGTPCYGDAGVIRSHYAYRINAAHSPNKYAGSHSYEKFKLSGPAANLADNGNPSLGYPEVGGDAGGCIVPAKASIHCTFSGASFQAAGPDIKYTLNAACTGGTPAANDYIAVSGLQSGGDSGVGEPDNGVFQITAVSGNVAGSTIKVASATGDTATPTGTGAIGTVSTGCSQ